MSAEPMSAREGGFALPVALLVLVLLSMISATGLHVARGDYRSAEATRQAAVALAAADAGASRTVATWAQLVPALPAPGDSVVLPWLRLPDGSEYRSVVVRAPVGGAQQPSPRVWMRTTAKLAPPAEARRTVVTVVEVGPGTICCTSAVKVTRRLDVTAPGPGLAAVDGVNRDPPTWAGICPALGPSVPGVRSSDTTVVDMSAPTAIAGNPPRTLDPTVNPSVFTNLGPTTYAALAAIANARFVGNQTFNNQIGPVITGGVCQTGNPRNWGSPLAPAGPCGGYFPVVNVAGNLILQGVGQGQGILLVDGDLTIQDTFRFHGIVIVLGTLRLRGPSTFYGGILVRANANGQGVNEVRTGGRILYSDCAVQRALAALPPAMRGGATGAREYSWFEPIG